MLFENSTQGIGIKNGILIINIIEQLLSTGGIYGHDPVLRGVLFYGK
jgi:hypothetical protein